MPIMVSLLIYRTRDRERLGFANAGSDDDITPIIAEDLTYGGKSTAALLTNGTYISNTDLYKTGFDIQFTVAERVNIFNQLIESQLKKDTTFQRILKDMMQHFVGGSGADYSDPDLTAAVQAHTKTQSNVNEEIAILKEEIEQRNGRINTLWYDENLWVRPKERREHPIVKKMLENGRNSKLPVFGWNNGTPGLTLAIDSLYGNTVEIESYSITATTYSGKLKFRFYDHFGLDTSDLSQEKYGGVKAGIIPGFRQWFILQHWKDLAAPVQPKPFVTVIEFSVPFEGKR